MNKNKFHYRRGVIGLVTDANKNILLVQMVDYEDNQWRFPGGGVEDGENDESALYRELEEELNTNKFKILKKSKYTNKYDWPVEVIERRFIKDGKRWSGQEQSQFLVKFTGDPSDIKPDPKELKRVKWVKLDEVSSHLVFPMQWELAEIVIEELLKKPGKLDSSS